VLHPFLAMRGELRQYKAKRHKLRTLADALYAT
jgi:hypothetical protein